MKFTNTKRFASLVMASVLALALAVPAFAAANTTVITGTYQDIEIAVEVPTTGDAQINPYGMPVSITKFSKETVEIVDQQITTQPLNIKNQGTTSLDVNASLAVVPKGDVEIKTSLGTTDKGKQVKVSLEVAALNDEAFKTLTGNDLNDALIDKFVDEATWEDAASIVAPAAAKNATSVATPSKSASAMASLGAATVDGRTITYGAKSIALVRLTGELNEVPQKTESGNTVDDPWATTDGFTATVVFSFKPTPKTPVTVTAAGSTSATANKAFEGETVTVNIEGATGETLTATVGGLKAGVTAPTLTLTETPASSGKYTGTFTMPATSDIANPATGITVTVSGF